MKVMYFWLIYSCLIFGTGILCDHKLERRKADTRCSEITKDTFSCSDGHCIEWSSVCDDREDCSDGSDENKELCNRYEYGMNKTIECGRVYKTSNSVSTDNDMKTLIGRSPWNVGIYVKDTTSSNYIFICGGSIIGPKLVASVGQCFWESEYFAAKVSIKGKYKVAVGKYQKSYSTQFEKVDNEFTQIINVESIYTHEDFNDPKKPVTYDIALVVLSNKIIFSNYVTPVCIDWSGKYNVRDEEKGQILTWRLGEESFLSETSLSYIDHNSCRNTYKSELSDDQFCGSSALGQIVSLFYFGSGLTFAHSNNSHFLTGVAIYENEIKNRSIVDFTDIKYHINWIRKLYIKYLNHDIPFCILPDVDGVIYSYEGSNTILARGTLINQYRTVIENCDVGYYKAYPRGFRVCQGNGKWTLTSEKLCFKMCPPLLSDSLDIKCTLNGKFTNCSNPSSPETIAVPSCKPTHTLPNGQEETPIELICQSDGMWDNQLYKCNPNCGRVYTNGKILIANGKKANVGTAPWNVGIYRLNKANSNYDLICGGSIISPNLVVTAAHCFWYKGILSKKMSINDGSYKVAVGKYDRNFTIIDNDFTRIIDVNIIYLHELFTGNQDYYAYDIAVILLSNIVSFSNVVAPICIDWSDRYNVSNGIEGKIVGWGNTENGTLSPVLLETSLPYLDHDSCRAMYTKGFHIFVTLDKFCAGSALVPGQDMGEGDSGSGLTFLHAKSYYLTGVLSLKQRSSNNSIALFTDFKHHIEWIRRLYQKHS